MLVLRAVTFAVALKVSTPSSVRFTFGFVELGHSSVMNTRSLRCAQNVNGTRVGGSGVDILFRVPVGMLAVLPV